MANVEVNMKINYEDAKLSDYLEIHQVMQTSARELSRKAYNGQLKDIFDKFYIEKTPDYIRQTLENPHSHTIVAINYSKIIGVIQLKLNNKIGIINHFYILPGFEGKSIGTRLFDLVAGTDTRRPSGSPSVDGLTPIPTMDWRTKFEINSPRNPSNMPLTHVNTRGWGVFNKRESLCRS